jgi:DNA-binding IclR family transcriptional regulator
LAASERAVENEMSLTKPSGRGALATVHNALALLDAFSFERPEWGVRELARAYALPQATTSRLVSALCTEGFLAQTPAKRYRLNLLLREIGVSAARGSDLYDLALPHAVRVRMECGLATTLWVLDGLDAVILERLGECEGEQRRSPRKRWPAYATCGGKAMLAFASQTLIEEVFRRPKEACTPYTLTQRAALASALDDIHRNGYAGETEESQIGWSGLGVPILTASGRCAGALGIEVPQPAWHPATAAKTLVLLRDAARTIGAELP